MFKTRGDEALREMVSGMVGMEWQLDWMLLMVFSKLSDPMKGQAASDNSRGKEQLAVGAAVSADHS